MQYTPHLYFRTEDFAGLTDFLDEKEIFWSNDNLLGSGTPPSELLELIAPLDELSCLRLSAKHDLVEEMVSMLQGNTQECLLEALLVGLVRLRILVGLAFKEENQSEEWLDWFSYGGNFEKMEKLFLPSSGKVFPAFGVLIVTKPIVPESQINLMFDRPEEPS